MLNIITNSYEETQAFAEKLGGLLFPGSLILLSGDLGSGKTTFTQGLAKGLGITSRIKSPTYTIMRDYPNGRLPLYHMDVYRLEESGGADLGLEDYIEGQGVCVIEWYEFIGDLLPEDFIKIHIERTYQVENQREIQMECVGAKYQSLLSKLSEEENH